MIGFRVEVEGTDVVIQKLNKLSDGLKMQAVPKAVRAALKAGHRAATALLSGAHDAPAGSYPVPVRIGFLRQSLGMVWPGQSKFGLSAGLFEGFLVNTAVYAGVIAETRPFLDDALPSEDLPWFLDAEINRLKRSLVL